MNKIVVLGVYFGKFPVYFDLWYKSCLFNNNIDFILFTDNDCSLNSENFKTIYMNLDSFRKLAIDKLNIDNIAIDKPYKICDFRPAFGLIFDDYIKKYAFWGYCDFDMIFGNVRKFITDDILEKYDKILTNGHLSLYKNNDNVNHSFMKSGGLMGNYIEVFTDYNNKFFDEFGGINLILKNNGYKLYDKKVFADISFHKRFRLARTNNNSKKQIFYYNNGIYRMIEKNHDIFVEEFCYIHFQKRKNMNHLPENLNKYIVCDDGFFDFENNIPSIDDINKYNKYVSCIKEIGETINFRILRKIKNMIGR